MTPRSGIWIAVVAVIAAVAAYLLIAREDTSRPGQPSPHALDQSQ